MIEPAEIQGRFSAPRAGVTQPALPCVVEPILRAHVLFLFLALAIVITLALQVWLGQITIYGPELAAKRLMLHHAIVANVPPEGGWAAVGAAALNIRVTAVFAAQFLHEWSGLGVLRSYLLMDTVFLFVLLLVFPLYLRRWLPPTWCLVGMLYFAALLPLSYFQHAFQPWDRMQLTVWLLLLALIRDDKFWPVLAVLALAMTIKFDTALVALLYGMAQLRRGPLTHTLLRCAALVVTAWAVLFWLKWAFPAPAEPARFSMAVATQQLAMNWRDGIELKLWHPALLAWGLPAVLALWGLHRRPQFLAAGVMFAAVLTLVWATFTVYAEIRGQFALAWLLLPPALLTLREWLEPSYLAAGEAAAG